MSFVDDQSLEDVNALKRRIAHLEAQLDKTSTPTPQAGRNDRLMLRADIEFIGDFDVVEAQGVDISRGGICFDVVEDLVFELKFEADGMCHCHRAKLVWMKALGNEGYRFGFQFVGPGSTPDF